MGTQETDTGQPSHSGLPEPEVKVLWSRAAGQGTSSFIAHHAGGTGTTAEAVLRRLNVAKQRGSHDRSTRRPRWGAEWCEVERWFCGCSQDRWLCP